MTRKPNILVVGSFVMDHIVTTSVFPNEGETVLGESLYKAPGGKGANQAVQAARLGANVTMIGKLGCDSNADSMISACKDANINVEHVLYDKDNHTGCSFIILEKIEDGSTVNRIIVIPGANMAIRKEEVLFLKDTIGDYDMVILQLEIPMEINALVCQHASDSGVPIMLNPAPSAYIPNDVMTRLTYISPNEHEASSLTGISIPNQPDLFSLDEARNAAEFLALQGAKNVVITLGRSGAINLNENGFIYSPSVDSTLSVDPTAAGDSFVASFCCASCLGMSSEDALCFANHAASLTVSRKGAMPSLPTLDEVRKHLLQSGKDFPELNVLYN